MEEQTSGERILVQLADHQWTLEATHHACQLARQSNAEVILLKMVPVQHLGWLGTDLGYCNFSEDDYQSMLDYAATAEDYGVNCSIRRYQYTDFVGGLCEVAEYLGVQVVFARPIRSTALMRTVQNWLLRRSLAGHNCQLVDSRVVVTLHEQAHREVESAATV